MIFWLTSMNHPFLCVFGFARQLFLATAIISVAGTQKELQTVHTHRGVAVSQ
jgi:hypothetical protein